MPSKARRDHFCQLVDPRQSFRMLRFCAERGLAGRETDREAAILSADLGDAMA